MDMRVQREGSKRQLGIRLPQWTPGILYGRKLDVPRGHVPFIFDVRHKQVLLDKQNT